jgi:tetratricopeptide (TPR) repeat protein
MSRATATALVLMLGTIWICASPRATAAPRTDEGPVFAPALSEGLRAAKAGKWPAAQKAFATALRDDLRNPRLQFLNGLAHWQVARRTDGARLALAKVGFESSAQQSPDDFWANLYLGYQLLEEAQYPEAQGAFGRATRARPDRWEAAYGLGVASYLMGDALTARLAAEQAVRLDSRAETQRLRLMTAALSDDGDVHALSTRYAADHPLDQATPRRVAEILRTAATTPATRGEAGAAAGTVVDNQIVVDLTIILSSVLNTRSRGVNLFDGLALQFGYGNAYSASRASGGTWSSNRTITQSIGVPQLDYSLNLFNNAGQFYHVLARPSLTAYLGQESEFFAGRTINVKVSGVNLGSLQPIDVGVGLKVLPEAIDGDRVRFRVSASRSFLSQDQVGSFDESLTTFKQLVSATAEVQFGQTLVMSALSETVDDNKLSKTPGLGDIPGVSAFFKESSKANRQESLLILITPVQATTFTAMTAEPVSSAAVQALVQAWRTQIDPHSNLAAIVERLRVQQPRRRGARGDLGWHGVVTPLLAAEALRENAEMAIH